MRAILHVLKIVIYVSLVAAVLAFALIALSLIIYGLIEVVLYNNGKEPPYNWSKLLGVSVSLIILWRLHKNKNSFRQFADDDGMLIWNISSGLVTSAFLFFFVLVCYDAIKTYGGRDRDKRINSLAELLDNSGRLQGQTITISPDSYDTAAISRDIEAFLKRDSLLWQPFISYADFFSAQFPGYEVLTKDEFVTTTADKYEMRTYYANMKDQIDYNRAYSISCMEMPPEHSVSFFFDLLKQHIVEQENGEVVADEAYNGRGFIGKKILLKTGNTEVVVARLIYYKKRIYLIRVVTNIDNSNNKFLNYFFYSVRLL